MARMADMNPVADLFHRAEPAEPAPSNRWSVAPADFAALLRGAVAAPLADHAILEFDGPDARSFLQGQTTIDMVALAPAAWQLGGYCTPKGRLLAIFQAWSYATGIRLLLPRALAPAIQKRLTQYVLRAKVVVRDVTSDWLAFGLCGAACAAPFGAAGIDVPAATWHGTVLDGDERLVRLPGGTGCPDRLLLLARRERHAHWTPLLAGFAPVEVALWWWTQVDAAIPAVLAATQELFVPQSINLEVLGGVDFRKGCYPGQEIVARSQYLGRLRRRMGLAHAAGLGAAADVFVDGESQPVGRIVLAASAPQGGWDLLFECPSDRVEPGRLHAGSAQAPALELRALPYRLFDPTA